MVVQVYLELTLKALESRPDEAQEGDGVNSGSEGTRHRSVGDGSCNDEVHAAHIRSLSPESLLLSAEAYTDRALDTGTGLPLARLVKGQALSLRGQHQVILFMFLPAPDRRFLIHVESKSRFTLRHVPKVYHLSLIAAPGQMWGLSFSGMRGSFSIHALTDDIQKRVSLSLLSVCWSIRTTSIWRGVLFDLASLLWKRNEIASFDPTRVG